MRIVSFNANGIRSAVRKGFFDWLKQHNPDIICIQETKIKSSECQDLSDITPQGYHVVYEDAEKGVIVVLQSSQNKNLKQFKIA